MYDYDELMEVRDELSLNLHNGRKSSYFLFDRMGRGILNGTCDGPMHLDLSKLPKGIYRLNVKGPDGRLEQRGIRLDH